MGLVAAGGFALVGGRLTVYSGVVYMSVAVRLLRRAG